MYMGCPCQNKQIGGKRSGRRRSRRRRGRKQTKRKRVHKRKMTGGGLLGDFQTSVLGTTNQLTGSIYTNPAVHIQPAGQSYTFSKYLV
jgi:hypothetical protein